VARSSGPARRSQAQRRVDASEPPVLLGHNEAPNPAEFALHALAGCLTAPAHATFPGQNGKIVFGGHVPGGISVIEPDGSGVELIVSDGRDPAWSADGRRLSYFRYSVGLHVSNGDGSGETLIRATSSSGTSTMPGASWPRPASA